MDPPGTQLENQAMMGAEGDLWEGFEMPNEDDSRVNRSENATPSTPLRSRTLTERIAALSLELVWHKGTQSFWACVNVPTLPASFLGSPDDPRDYVPHQLQETIPFAAFYPTTGLPCDTIFGCLVKSAKELDDSMTQNFVGSWKLDPVIQEEWFNVELKLCTVLKALQSITPLPHSINSPNLPTQDGGYRRLYVSKSRAVRAALRSINCFADIVAALAFYLCYWKSSSASAPFESIARHISTTTNIDPAWFEQLLSSPVGILPPSGRAGVFVNMGGTGWYKHLVEWAEYGVPLWINMTSSPHVHLEEAVRLSGRDSDYVHPWISRCEELYNGQPDSIPKFNPNSFIDPAASLRYTQLSIESIGCNQLPLETPDQFFRRSEKEMLFIEHNSPLPPPNEWSETHEKEGIRYYHWRMFGGQYFRYLVSPLARARTLYIGHPLSQRRFNPVENSFDLCWLLDPGNGPTIFDAEAFDVLDHFPRSPTTHHVTTLIPGLYETTTLDPDDASDYGSDDADDVALGVAQESLLALTAPLNREHGLQQLDRILRRRLGYSPPNNSLPEHEGGPEEGEILEEGELREEKGAGIPRGADRALSAVGLDLQVLQHDEISGPSVVMVANVVQEGISGGVLSSPWDISPASVSPLQLGPLTRNLRIRSGGDGCYIIGTADKPFNAQWWVLVVPSAVAVLEIIRYGYEGILEMAREMSALGMQFYTARYLPRDSAHPSIPSLKRTGLGVRWYDTKWSQEYSHYELARDRILSGPRGRVALRMGGVIGRMAKDVVGKKEAALPPSSSAKGSGMVVALDEGCGLYTDCLTQAEVDILLGTYRERDRDGKESLVTWWPTQALFRGSGLNAGEWTPRCEQWFHGRLERVREGVERPRKRDYWKRELRMVRETRKLWTAYETRAQVFLDSRI